MVLRRTSIGGRAGRFEMPAREGKPVTELARRPSACRGAGCLGSSNGLTGSLGGIAAGEQQQTVMWLIMLSTASIAKPSGVRLVSSRGMLLSAGHMMRRHPGIGSVSRGDVGTVKIEGGGQI
jgi:hypothetical protein